MRSCIEWRKSFRYLSEIDQFNIEYKINKTRELLNFLDIYGISQRVNIYTGNLTKEEIQDAIDVLIDIKELNKYKFSIVMNKNSVSEEEINKIKENNIDFYFLNLIDTWDDLLGVLNMDVSDVFIGRDLGFELTKVAAAVQHMEKPAQIRCYANLCQTLYGYDDGLKTFFIRPEDVAFYDDYIDIIEFWDSVDIQSTLYEIYFHTHKWNGNLQEIIKGLKKEINNQYIITGAFAEYRISCERKCYKGGSCSICKKIALLADTIKNSEEYEMFSKYHKKKK